MLTSILWFLWLLLLAGIAAIWASRHWEISRAKREHVPLKSDAYPGPPREPPRVSVLIAAKDEEANIGPAISSMLAQDYPNFELIAINDRSTDRTPQILEDLKSRDASGRLKVIHVNNLREGWFGKNNAMREGLNAAEGEWFCFGDADCRQTSNRSLSMAVRHAVEWNIDFLSVLPGLETQSLWERIIQPVCGGLMVFWFHPRRVNDPKNPAAYANGAFMLMRRSCYEAIGGHEQVRTEVNEDMHMARIAKERGQRLVVVQSGDLYTVRMYSRFKDIWRGWTRIFYGCFGTFSRLRKTMLLLLVMSIFPYISTVWSGIVLASRGWSESAAGWQWAFGLSVLAVVLQQTVIARFYRISRANPWLAPTWIVGAVICVGMLANAMLKLKGRTTLTWRGTTYRGHELATPTTAPHELASPPSDPAEA
jgi:cellulose synthase/poly-beta-1,6-N-acetylglucosamine synthase-like glycosyltransferase